MKAYQPTDPGTWTGYDTAILARATYDGVGCMIGAPFVGIDLDKVRNPQSGQTEDWALHIIRELTSYMELSPSGTGYHIWIQSGTKWYSPNLAFPVN